MRPLQWGQLVDYRGSITDAHNTYRLGWGCVCTHCTELEDNMPPAARPPDPETGAVALEHVGRDSITPADPPDSRSSRSDL